MEVETPAGCLRAPLRATWATKEGGQLTDGDPRRPMPCCCRLRWRRPTPGVQTCCWQVLDDGLLTDPRDARGLFRNTVVVMEPEPGQAAPSSSAPVSDQQDSERQTWMPA